jgi:hypothetical protein
MKLWHYNTSDLLIYAYKTAFNTNTATKLRPKAAAFEDTDGSMGDNSGGKSLLSTVDPRLPFAMKCAAYAQLINRTSKNPLIRL